MGNIPLIVAINHLGGLQFDVEQLGYKALVIIGPIVGQDGYRFGRLIQVRKKSGAFGTDTILVRESDGNLYSYQNMTFNSVHKDSHDLFIDAMRDVDEKAVDKPGDEYSITGKNKASGFVVHGLNDLFL